MRSYFFFFLFLWISSCLLGFGFGAATVSRNITVSKEGNGDFTTIQAAVDSVPDGNNQWIRIHVKSGTYMEQVTIPNTKEFIALEGEGQDKTVIEFNRHVDPGGTTTEDSATFTLHADNFVARFICFKNSYNHAFIMDGNVSQAVAALVSSDKVAFYDCKFVGYQDTLCDKIGRHYFSRCWIEGYIDFIFGYAQSLYEFCVMNSLAPNASPGWVTAHDRINADSNAGFVFKQSEVKGGRTYLGRSWGPLARVIFYKSMLTNIVPAGWDIMKKDIDDGKRTTFAEVGCMGPGSDMSHRVPWEKNLTWPELKNFIDKRVFIDADQWLDQQP